MLKKTTLAVLGLAVNGFAFAGAMGPVCAPGSVTVPCEAQRWSFGIDALYFKAVNSANRTYQTNLLDGVNGLNNDWNWGFRAEAGYQYGTGNDVAMSWMHYSNDMQQSNLMGRPTPLSQNLVSTIVSSENRFDQVNVVLGQHVDVSATHKGRFYGGMQYASIEQNKTDYFAVTGTTPVSFSSTNFFNNTDFTGFGPVIGMDYSYYFSPQVSLVADGSTALLYGSTRVSTGYVFLPTNLVLDAHYASKKEVVPSFEAKLGVNYEHTMAQGSLNLQGGYRVVDYMDALQVFTGSSTFPVSTVDYALYGPYIGLKYVGNA